MANKTAKRNRKRKKRLRTKVKANANKALEAAKKGDRAAVEKRMKKVQKDVERDELFT